MVETKYSMGSHIREKKEASDDSYKFSSHHASIRTIELVKRGKLNLHMHFPSPQFINFYMMEMGNKPSPTLLCKTMLILGVYAHIKLDRRQRLTIDLTSFPPYNDIPSNNETHMFDSLSTSNLLALSTWYRETL